jgi:hypothetical protein
MISFQIVSKSALNGWQADKGLVLLWPCGLLKLFAINLIFLVGLFSLWSSCDFPTFSLNFGQRRFNWCWAVMESFEWPEVSIIFLFCKILVEMALYWDFTIIFCLLAISNAWCLFLKILGPGVVVEWFWSWFGKDWGRGRLCSHSVPTSFPASASAHAIPASTFAVPASTFAAF